MSTLKVAPEEDGNKQLSVSSLDRARSDGLTLRQGQFGYDLAGGANAGLWDGDGRITCFRNRLENVRNDVDISCSCFNCDPSGWNR